MLTNLIERIVVGPKSGCFWRHYQKAKNSKNKIWRKFHALYCEKIMRDYNASIPITTEFLGRPNFPHELNGILISMGAKIGRNCTIFQQVTIGSVTTEGSRNIGAPIIGDNVLIGAGAKIIGNVHIGDGARIGANCVVTKDVPANATVVMPQPRIIQHDNQRNNSFVSFDRIDR